MAIDQNQYMQCIQAFLTGDHSKCAQIGLPMISEGATLQLLQVVLISLQRLGKTDMVGSLGSMFVQATEQSPWEQQMLKLTLGQADPDKISELTSEEFHRCQALYYSGAYFVSMGLTDSAREVFQACLEVNADCPERHLAISELQAIKNTSPSATRQKELASQIGEMNQQAVSLQQAGRYEEAIQVAERARSVASEALGEYHPNYGVILNNLASLYQHAGRHQDAVSLFRQAAEISRSTLGESHAAYASNLHNLASLYQGMGRFKDAEELYARALEIRRTALGERHPEYATNLNNLALVYQSMGRFAEAEPLYQMALEVRREALGRAHPEYATSLNNLAGLYQTTGRYSEAMNFFKQALEIRRATVGDQHPDCATYMNNVAAMHGSLGHFLQAELLYKDALEIQSHVLGRGHAEYAKTLMNLSILYSSIGRDAQAASLLTQVLEIRQSALGEDHPEYAQTLKVIASHYNNMGRCDDAAPLYQRALEVQRRTLGQDHPEYAQTLNSLAGLFTSVGRYTDAALLYREALEIRGRVLGNRHPDYANTLNDLATLYVTVGQYDDAKPVLQRAVGILRQVYGENHPEYSAGVANLAMLSAAAGRHDEALALWKEALVIGDRIIGQVFAMGSEKQRADYLATVRTNPDAYLSLVLRYFPNSVEAVRSAFDLCLRRKAIEAEALAAQRDALIAGKYPHLEPRFREWSALRSQITQKSLAGPGEVALDEHERQLEEWTKRKDEIESILAQQIAEINIENKLRSVNYRAVLECLPQGSALVEFIRFQECDFRAVAKKVSEKQWRAPRHWKGPRYVAFVLRSGETDGIRMIDLGAAEEIDSLIARFRADISGEGRGLGAVSTMEETDASNDAGIALRSRVFDPLQGALDVCHRLIIAPDGDLSKLPFEVLPLDSSGSRVVNEYVISYVAVGRDILRFGVRTAGEPGEPVVLADPDFDLASAAPAEGAGESAGSLSRDLSRDGTIRFGRLPGTRVEGECVATMMGIAPWLEAMALETRLKQCRSPRILHLATHGFFLEDQPYDPNEERGSGISTTFTGGELGRLAGGRLENPLLRSGLALSGANTWLVNKPVPAEAEDGILTAEDVTGLDLLSTELVVLSACETGLGEVRTGEGVFGLRRSFILAGAKTLVMSLWKVPDAQTQELMVSFYEGILSGKPRAEALRSAQLSLKKRYPDPLYWGAFICQGDPGPLEAYS